jgi:hypothetical protein
MGKQSDWQEIQDYIISCLKLGQESGYVVPENEDYEIGMWMGATAYEIAQKAFELMKPDEYIRVDGKFYAKSGLRQLAEGSDLADMSRTSDTAPGESAIADSETHDEYMGRS